MRGGNEDGPAGAINDAALAHELAQRLLELLIFLISRKVELARQPAPLLRAIGIAFEMCEDLLLNVFGHVLFLSLRLCGAVRCARLARQCNVVYFKPTSCVTD